MRVKLEMITRARAESAVPLDDCSGRLYSEGEREDLIRYVLWGAEIQYGTDQGCIDRVIARVRE